MPDFWQELRSAIQKDLDGAIPHAKSEFSLIRKPKAQPTPKQLADEFLNMPTEQRMQLAMSMQPEEYQNYVNQRIDYAVNEYGQQAEALQEYYQQDFDAIEEMLIQQELNAVLGGAEGQQEENGGDSQGSAY